MAEVPRIRAAIERYGRRFIDRIYTPAEIAYVERKANRYERFAARFAAKEAGMKAIGTGWRRGVRWKDFEVTNLPSGKPTLRFHGQAAHFAERLGVKSIALSLTHTAELGMAHVILEGLTTDSQLGLFEPLGLLPGVNHAVDHRKVRQHRDHP